MLKVLFLLSFLVTMLVYVQRRQPAQDFFSLSLSEENVRKILASWRYRPNFSSFPEARIDFGKKLFFDQRLSSNGQVSCATCHNPQYSFSEPFPHPRFGVGGEEKGAISQRRTPSLVNVKERSWLFWDGRADSLEMQSLGPLENPWEHGLDRTTIVGLIRDHYKEDYEKNFGNFPSLPKNLPKALPEEKSVKFSKKILAFTLASLPWTRTNHILKQKTYPIETLSQYFLPAPSYPGDYALAWENLPESMRKDIDKVFLNIGKALAAFETTIVSHMSPFDHFVERFQSLPLEKSFNDQFDKEAYEGLKVFLKSGCANCHYGPFFSDNQFHNMGFSSPEVPLDLGRAQGILQIVGHPWNGQGNILPCPFPEKGSCAELPFLDVENIENVGSMKTPSLRGVAMHPPYGHDGRFPHLRDVIRYYNTSKEEPELGHKEETLQPLNLSLRDEDALLWFLESLNAKVFYKDF